MRYQDQSARLQRIQKLPENIFNLQCFGFCAVNDIHFSKIFSVNVDSIVLHQIVFHSLKYERQFKQHQPNGVK